jgi:putative transposase
VEQIVGVLKQAEVGVPVAELIRQVGITEQTLYRWKKQYKGLETDQVRQFKQLQEENGRLKRLAAELTLDKVMLQDVLAKKTVTPSRRRPDTNARACGDGRPPSFSKTARASTKTPAARAVLLLASLLRNFSRRFSGFCSIPITPSPLIAMLR